MTCRFIAIGLLSGLLLGACATSTPKHETPSVTGDRVPATAPEKADTAAAGSATTSQATSGATLADAMPPGPVADRHRLELLADSLDDPQCRPGRVVNRWISHYQERPQRWDELWRNRLPLLEWVQARVVAAGLPGEFALIPMVESHFRPDARNRGNTGMWQLSAITAGDLGLSVDSRRDERLDPIPATDTALTLLQHLMHRFGDWRLAAMAYNAGEYRVARALQSMPDSTEVSAAAHQPPGLSNTTYEYLAKLEALSCLVAEPAARGLALPAGDDDELVVVTVPEGFRSLGRLARITGIDESTAARLNPASDRYRIDQRGRRLLLPATQARRIESWRKAVASGAIPPAQPEQAVTHVVERGDSLWTIARRHRLHTRDIQSWNALPDGVVLHPGQILRLEP